MMKISFGVLVLEGLVGHHRMVQLQFLHLSDWGVDFDYCDIRIGSANYQRYFWPKQSFLVFYSKSFLNRTKTEVVTRCMCVCVHRWGVVVVS